MTRSLNKIILLGNVGNQPEFKTLNNGEMASFSIATSETWKDKMSGERKEKTEWHKVVVFNETFIRIIKSFIKKGSKIYIEGQLQTRKWVDKENIERYTTEVVLQNFKSTLILLDGKESHIGGEKVGAAVSNNNYEGDDLDDEIPF